MRGGGRHASAGSRLSMDWFTDIDDYRSFQDERATELAAQRALEDRLAVPGSRFLVPGRCTICGRNENLEADWSYSYEVGGKLTPNWRERLVCPSCGLNNRMRATVFVFKAMVASPPGSKVFLAEQLTPIYEWFQNNVPGVVGSEYLGSDHVPGRENEMGVRHENLTALSFGSEDFGVVVCLDVLEHVPDYLAAVREIRRVLHPGGSLVLSVPMILSRREHLVRAEIMPDGSVSHLEEPEFHGDPIRSEGCLSFYHFGWAILEDLRNAGFVNVGMLHYWSEWLGFLGPDQVLILAMTPN